MAKIVNNRGPRDDPWKTPMEFGSGLEKTWLPEEEEMQTVRVYAVELELGKEQIVRNNVEAFAEVEDAEEGDVAAVHAGKDPVRD